jgi:HK97 family phage portal protein
VKGLFRSALKAMTRMTFPRVASWFIGWSDLKRSDYDRVVGDGLDHNVLVAPLLWVVRTFPEAVLAVRTEDKKGKRTVLRQHEMCKLVARPNKSYTGDALWFATIISFLTDGNAYWVKIRGVGGKPGELWYLPHWLVEPKGDESTFITHYEYRAGGKVIRLEPEDVVHFRYGLDPRNPLKGFAPLRVLMTEIFNDAECANLVAALLANKGVPGLVISPEKDVVVDPKDEGELKQYVLDKTTGSHRGEPLVVSAAVKVQQYGFSPKELDLSATRSTSEERVCATIGVRAAVVGFGTGLEQTKVGATMKEETRLSWTGCLLPMQRMMAAELTRSMLPEFEKDPNAEAYFDPSEVEALQANMLERAKVAEAMTQSGVGTRADGRRLLSLDVTDEDEVFYIPFSAIVTPRDEKTLPAESTRTQPEGAKPPAGAATDPGAKNAKRLTRMQSRILRAHDVAYKRFEPPFRAKVAGILERLGAQIEAAYLSESAKAAGDELRVERVFSQVDMTKTESDLRGIFGLQAYEIYKDNLSTLGALGISVGLPDSAAVEVLAQGGSRAGLLDLSKTGREKALKIIEDAREQGLGVPETARLLRDSVPAGRFADVATRAELIARTETRFAQNMSALKTYQAIEGVDQVVIIDGRLGPTDADCEAINGETVSFEQAAQLLADEHPNGTRDLVPVFQEA